MLPVFATNRLDAIILYAEEKTLVNALGESYRQYMKRTKRFIPFVY